LKLKIIEIALLFSIFFNISHASVLATQEHCEHKSVAEYSMEQNQDSNCGDICDVHHMFHLSAIIISYSSIVKKDKYNNLSTHIEFYYYPPSKEKAYKPPIYI
jgi:hypothetical protein